MKEQDLRDKISYVELKEFSSTKLIDKCVQIAKDYAEQEAIEFGQWMHKKTVYVGNKNHFIVGHTGFYDISKVYQLFKNRENER